MERYFYFFLEKIQNAYFEKEGKAHIINGKIAYKLDEDDTMKAIIWGDGKSISFTFQKGDD